MDTNCVCQVCGERIECDDSGLGQKVVCPHCECETVLATAPTAIVAAAPVLAAYTEGIDTKCPGCGSGDTIKCSVAWERGTSHGRFSGLGTDLGGDLGAFGGVRTSQTLFAAGCAPPKTDSSRAIPFAAIFLVGMVTAFWGLAGFCEAGELTSASAVTMAIGFVLICLSSVFIFIVHLAARDRIRAAVRQWMMEWVCMRCGKRFNPSKLARQQI